MNQNLMSTPRWMWDEPEPHVHSPRWMWDEPSTSYPPLQPDESLPLSSPHHVPSIDLWWTASPSRFWRLSTSHKFQMGNPCGYVSSPSPYRSVTDPKQLHCQIGKAGPATERQWQVGYLLFFTPFVSRALCKIK